MPFPLDWSGLTKAPPRKLLVQRAEQPLVRGRILIPEGIRSSTRASEATVISVGEGVSGFAVGDGLLLASSVGQGIAFGDRDEVKYALVDIFQVMGKVNGRQTATLGTQERPLAARDRPGRFAATDDRLHGVERDLEPGGTLDGYEEGDLRGKR